MHSMLEKRKQKSLFRFPQTLLPVVCLPLRFFSERSAAYPAA
jgi:hypothetical protein